MKNFKQYQYRRIMTKENKVADGDYIIENSVTIRVKNGLLNDSTDEEGNLLPAIETTDGTHIEHWKDGVLHCDKEPAVIDHIDNSRGNNRLDNLRIVTHYDNLTKNQLSVERRREASRRSIQKAIDSQKVAVVMIDDDGTEHWFPCGAEAARATGTHFTSISQVLHGKLRHAGGKRWRKAEVSHDA